MWDRSALRLRMILRLLNCREEAGHGFMRKRCPSYRLSPEGKIERPSAEELAKRAIQSLKSAADGRGGISYLMANLAERIVTPLTPAYEAEILRQTKTKSLEEAVRTLKSGAS
jgi:hypothetical protein